MRASTQQQARVLAAQPTAQPAAPHSAADKPELGPLGPVVDRLSDALLQANRERHAANQRLELAQAVFQQVGEAILVSDRDGAVLAVNPAFTALTGYSAEQLLGRPTGTLELQSAAGLQQDNPSWQSVRLLRGADGRSIATRVKVAEVRDQDGAILGSVSTFIDLGPLKEAEARLRHQIDHDPLTGLPGLRLLQQALADELPRASRQGHRLALLVLGIDRIAAINEVYGQAGGDRLLVLLASRTRGCLDPRDRLYRIGNDALAIVVDDLRQAGDAIPRAARLLETLVLSCEIGGQAINGSVSIGIGVAPEDATEGPALIAAAQTARRRADELGGHNAQFFTPALGERTRRYIADETALRQAVAQRGFELHFQAQHDCASGALLGFEALARWHHPTLGLVSIGPYIEVAEESGLIHLIGEWALIEACHQAVRWPMIEGRALRVGVNVSARQIARGGLVDQVRNALKVSGLAPQRLEIELTESSLQTGSSVALTLHELKRLGATIALDDFGIGFSSLESLKKLPVDRLKIDRGFVANLLSDDGDAGIVQSMVWMARALGRKVIAEGVEDLHQLEWLRLRGCDEFQGYLAGRPVPARQVAGLIGCGHFLECADADGVDPALAPAMPVRLETAVGLG